MLYKPFIEDNLSIVDKQGKLVRFVLNGIQDAVHKNLCNRLCVLKSRQMGVSSYVMGTFAMDLILGKNMYNVVVADLEENAVYLLDKIKLFVRSYESFMTSATGKSVVVPLKYDSRFEVSNKVFGTTVSIGTAKNHDFGRSRTIRRLHLSEMAFYPDIERIIAGAGQAVSEDGQIIVETTANGFNPFKTFWDQAKRGENGFKALFFAASQFYGQDFLESKRKELSRLYAQEYPENDLEAFLTSGDCYFDTDALKESLKAVRPPLRAGDLLYV